MTNEELDKAYKVILFLRYKIWAVQSEDDYLRMEPTEEEKHKAFDVCLEILDRHIGAVTFDSSTGDCISREAVIEILSNYGCTNKEGLLFKDIRELPSVKPKERTGHWVAVYQGDEIINYRCTECEFGNTFGKSTYRMNYCPNCGARMIESDNKEKEE